MANYHECLECRKRYSKKEHLDEHYKQEHSKIFSNSKDEKIPKIPKEDKIVVSEKKAIKKPSKNRKIVLMIIFILILGVIGVISAYKFTGFAFRKANPCQDIDIREMDITNHQGTLIDYEVSLKIVIDNKIGRIPENIGNGIDYLRPLHTHSDDGVIHVTSYCDREFSLEDFFIVWNQDFSKNNILGKSSEHGEIELIVNGAVNDKYEKYVLKKNDKIEIRFLSEGL